MADKEKIMISLSHGNGGRQTHELIKKLMPFFRNRILDEMADAAEFVSPGARLAFSTDSFVIKPLFFPGGDIGKLAVCGTVNDISMKGATPLYLSLSFIIEEGFPEKDLLRIAASAGRAAKESGVSIVTGDIKVVEKGHCDGVFINTSGIGSIPKNAPRIGAKAKPGDMIVINGSIAEHGVCVLNARENMGLGAAIKSDCQNLNFVVRRCLKASDGITVMRDLTRGGLGTSLCEIAMSSNLGIIIEETAIPVKQAVRKTCELLGFDPVYVANEGKFVCFVKEKDALKIRSAMGPGAAIIGRVSSFDRGKVIMRTSIGTKRLIPMLETDQLPRIC